MFFGSTQLEAYLIIYISKRALSGAITATVVTNVKLGSKRRICCSIVLGRTECGAVLFNHGHIDQSHDAERTGWRKIPAGWF
jgi:hypothetical protein